ncbi:MAG: protein kinase, partial [Candidatus Eiseniibacteriota bacterium]
MSFQRLGDLPSLTSPSFPERRGDGGVRTFFPLPPPIRLQRGIRSRHNELARLAAGGRGPAARIRARIPAGRRLRMQDRRPGEHDDRQATRIGRYLVEGELGRGGMGVVYLARDPVLERPIAIKVLPPATALDERWARRFVHEAKVLASLNHPNIATIHSLEEVEGRFFLTLELIEGDTLEKRLADGALPLDEVISIGLQIARALEAAHERGIVHRDLKPANVRITPAGLVKVLDFGIAKVTVSNSEAGAAATQEGPIGTPGYMSPEQIAGQPVSCQSDIWAFGCVLYECLAGRSAFGGRNLFEAMFRTTEREPDWGLLAEDVPEALVSLLRRCLAKDPRSRPDAMVAVRRELDELAVSRSGPAVRRAAGDGAEDAGPDGRHNLPQRLTAFIGRERQLTEIDTLVGLQRLVTLTGAGGSGKSRLAMEVAGRMLDRFADGIWLVELAPLTAGVAVVDAVAAVLDLKEQQGCSVGEALTANLAGRQLLLILDNCEHLLETCGALVV